MKKTILAIAAAIMMSANVMAQENNGNNGFRPRMNKDEMAKQRTERMVKEYGLDEKQSKELQTLNAQYAEKMAPMMGRGMRGGRPGGRGDMRDGKRPERRDSAMRGQHRPPMDGSQMMKREDFEKIRKDYDEGVKKIMTDEQYKKYKANEEQRRKQGPRGRRNS